MPFGNHEPLNVRFSDGKHARKKVFIGGLAAGTTTEVLRSIVSGFGTILNIHVLAKNKRSPCGFVTFALASEADRCISELHGAMNSAGTKRLMVKMGEMTGSGKTKNIKRRSGPQSHHDGRRDCDVSSPTKRPRLSMCSDRTRCSTPCSDISNGNSQSNMFPNGNSQSNMFPNGNSQSNMFPNGNSQSNMFPNVNSQSSLFPNGNSQSNLCAPMAVYFTPSMGSADEQSLGFGFSPMNSPVCSPFGSPGASPHAGTNGPMMMQQFNMCLPQDNSQRQLFVPVPQFPMQNHDQTMDQQGVVQPPQMMNVPFDQQQQFSMTNAGMVQCHGMSMPVFFTPLAGPVGCQNTDGFLSPMVFPQGSPCPSQMNNAVTHPMEVQNGVTNVMMQ